MLWWLCPSPVAAGTAFICSGWSCREVEEAVSVPLYQAKAEFFRMLGHPVRIRVLELLQDGPMPVRELLAAIEVEPSSLSQQLAVLRQPGDLPPQRAGRPLREHRALRSLDGRRHGVQYGFLDGRLTL